MTARSYRAVIDSSQSSYLYEPSFVLVPIFPGEPEPVPPSPTRLDISGSFDLELRTYTWVTDTAGSRLTEPVVESWLFFLGVDIDSSDPAFALSLPSTVLEVAPDGGFTWNVWTCPTFPEAPWAPGYHSSCSIWTTYSAYLSGSADGTGFELKGAMSAWPFGPSESYRIVATLEPTPLAPGDDPASIPIPGTAVLLLSGLLALARRQPRRTDSIS